MVDKRDEADKLIDELAHTWRALASLMILVGGYKGLVKYRRDSTSNRIGRRILAISLQASVPDSVARLLELRDEIQRRVQRRWWRAGELDKPRWRYLHDLIELRIREAKENLARALVMEIRATVEDGSLDEETRRQRQSGLETRIWTCFENGELDASQHRMLLGMFERSGRQIARS